MRFRDDIAESSGGSKNFLKLKDKESVMGIFMGDPYEFYSVWENGRGREVSPETPNASFRFRINFVVKDGATYIPKIFENGITVYRQLAELHKEYPLDSVVVKITRNGSTKSDTTYSLLPLLKQQITKETLAHLKTLELLPLEAKATSGAQSGDGEPEIPF